MSPMFLGSTISWQPTHALQIGPDLPLSSSSEHQLRRVYFLGLVRNCIKMVGLYLVKH